MKRKVIFNQNSVMADGVMLIIEILLERNDFTKEELKKMKKAKDRFGLKIFKKV